MSAEELDELEVASLASGGGGEDTESGATGRTMSLASKSSGADELTSPVGSLAGKSLNSSGVTGAFLATPLLGGDGVGQMLDEDPNFEPATIVFKDLWYAKTHPDIPANAFFFIISL